MSTASIFDCGSPSGPLDLPRRELISYNDDDIFSFENGDESSSADKIDRVDNNFRITLTINTGDDNRKRKRVADDDNDDGNDDGNDNIYHEPKKKRISNLASCSGIGSSNAFIRNGEQTIEKHTKATRSDAEPYTLLKEIGQGTYGRVYRAQFNDKKNIVIAIKRIKCKLNAANTVST